MAVPLQYQSQYIPTDFNTLGNVIGMFRQDMQQRNQEYDQGVAMRDKALSEIYGMKTLDPEIFQQLGDTLSKRIDELATKRGMDYGAAAPEISRLISQEARNPIYRLNQRKLEQVAMLEEALARNPNLLPLQDPRNISLTQKGLSPEDIRYSVANPEDVQQAIKDIYGDRAKMIRQSNLTKTKNTPLGYLESTITRGLTDADIQALQQDPSTQATLLARIPQLQQYMNNPEVANWFNNQVQQGLVGLKGGSQKQFVRDYLTDTDTGTRVPTWLAGANMPQVGIDDTRLEKTDKPLLKEANNLSKLAENINKPISQEDLTLDKVNPELISTIQQEYNISDADLNSFNKRFPALNRAEALNALLGQRRIYVPELSQKVNKEAVINRRNKELEEAKDKYSNYYSEGMTDEEFLNTVSKELTDRAKKTDKLFSLNVEGYDALARLNLRSDEQFSRKGSNKQYSLNEIYKQYKDKGATELYSKSSPMFDDNLNIVVQGYDNELYEMKPSTDIHRYYAERLKFLKGLKDDTNVTLEEQNQFKNISIPLPGTNTQVSFDFIKPDNKPLQKLVNLTYPDDSSETGTTTVQMKLDDFVNVVYKNIAQNAIFAQQLTPNE